MCDVTFEITDTKDCEIIGLFIFIKNTSIIYSD